MQFIMDQLGVAPFIAFAIVALVVYAFLIASARSRRSGTYYGRYKYRDSSVTPLRDVDFAPRDAFADSTRQLAAVMQAPFQKKRILSHDEYRVLCVVEQHLATLRQGHRVFAQTCLGEILKSDNDAAFRSINSKRVDILVVDRAGWAVMAVEYQGQGHHQGTAAARDAVKKEALRLAGIGYVEVYPGDSDEQILRRLADAFGRVAAFGTRTAPIRSPGLPAPAEPPAAASSPYPGAVPT